MSKRWLAAFTIALGAANQSWAQGGPPSNMVKTTTVPPLYAVAATDLQLKGFDKPSVRADTAYSFVSNKTRLVASPGVPLQVVYTAPDGAVALWFPQNGEVRRGRWHVEENKWQLMENGVPIKTRMTASICFDYSGAIPNILGPEWQRSAMCRTLEGIRQSMLDRRDGDMFDLAGGQARKALGPVNVRKLQELARRP
jgi:hypothetical protein